MAMNLISCIRSYMNSVLKTVGKGIKALIFDKDTLSIISVVYPQSELLLHEFYLYEKIEAMSKDPTEFVKGIFIIRSTEMNINRICDEISQPRFEKYYLFFTSTLDTAGMEMIAKADIHHVVIEIQEVYMVFQALESNIFVTNQINYKTKAAWKESELKRCTDALFALLLSTKQIPDIKFDSASKICADLANSIHQRLSYSFIDFDSFNSIEKNLIIIIERRFDPLTPLLLHWTYQSMIHEYFSIKNNIVNISSVPNIHSDFQEINLSPEIDGIFRDNMHQSFSQLAVNIQTMVAEFQAFKKEKHKMDTLDDIKDMVDSFPKFRKVTNFVSKHIILASELNTMAKNLNHQEQSEFEQSLIQIIDPLKSYFQILIQLISKVSVKSHDALRLAMIYLIVNPMLDEKEKTFISSSLANKGCSSDELFALKNIIPYSYDQEFNMKFLSRQSNPISATKKYFKNIMNVEETYEQHKPLLTDFISNPYGIGSLFQLPSIHSRNILKDQLYINTIIFIIGGFTYSESSYLNELQKIGNTNYILGGTMIHNSKTFIQEVSNYYQLE